jgi:formate dehydrogenase major subunit
MASTRLPVEALHTFKQIFKGGLATSTEEGATSAQSAKVARNLGKPFEGKLGDLQNADLVVVIGANLVDNHEVAGFFVKRNMPHGIKLVTIDPGSNPLEPLADLALHPNAGTDIEIIRGLTAVLKARDWAFQQASEKTGVPAADIKRTAELLGEAKSPVIVYGKGITNQSAPAALEALVELAQAGHAKLVGTKGQANSLAAALFGLDQPLKIEKQQGVFIAMGDEFPSQRLIQNVAKTPFLVVQAAYASQLTGQANVVLPVTTWMEQEGHYLNLEGKLQKAEKVIEPEAGIYSNQAALEELAARLGVKLDDGWKSALLETVSPTALEL